MTEIEYVRSQAREDQNARADAITELRAAEAELAKLWRENMRLRLRIAELETA